MALNGFYLSRFSFQLRAIDTLRLPQYKGSTFRGGFGHAFKKVVCTVRGKPCSECLLKMKCVYVYIFETLPPEGSEVLRNYKSIPHPFIIEPPDETRCSYESGDTLSFNLILIGRAIDYLPYFIYTFNELGMSGIGKGRGRYELALINSTDSGEVIYSSEDKALKGSYTTITPSNLPRAGIGDDNTLLLHFLTPARIVNEKKLTFEIEFHHLIRNLLRRISNLSYFHCGTRLEIDFKGLIEKAEKVIAVGRDLRWYDWERYSARQDTKMKLGGFIGTIGFKGDLEPFIPFLSLGELIHLGKGTSFGLGRYKIREKDVNNLS